LASTDNLTSKNQETEHIQTQKVPLINNNIHTKTYGNTKDRKPGLVGFYIGAGNGVGLFLQPWSPHVSLCFAMLIGISYLQRLIKFTPYFLHETY